MLTPRDGLKYYLERILNETTQKIILFTAASSFSTEAPIASFIAQEPLETEGYERQPFTISSINYNTLTTQSETNLVTVEFAASSTGTIQYDSIGVLVGGKDKANQAISSISGTPAVFNATAHGFVANDPVIFTDATVAPSGLTLGTTYYVLSTDLTTASFKIAATVGGSALNIGTSWTGDLIVRGVGGRLIHWEPRPDDGLGNRTYTINSSQTHSVQAQFAMDV